MRKAVVEGEDQYEVLLELRSTPRQGGLPSPAQLMFGRTTRTLISQRALKGENPERPEWKSVQILKKKGTRSYEVQGENGGTYIRNRVHLRRKETPILADPGDEDESALSDAVIDPPLENFTPDRQPNDIPASADRQKCDIQPPKWMKDFVAQ
ncbi:hypothetical protein RRG08_006634 [Elysia crispata]|uniref:Uncharacterized protein n=1 Tax=Elysia crispata TaxID=231223 RepID=A0AAE1D5F9_9GAST|nr:hypothetical protein RRG08_006634 [Elysia crispata]